VTALRFLGARNSRFGYMEDAEYIKWRELSITYNAPRSLARTFSADRLSITLSGRNLLTSTKYTGIDPEVNGQGEALFAQRDFLSLPPLRSYNIRVNLGF